VSSYLNGVDSPRVPRIVRAAEQALAEGRADEDRLRAAVIAGDDSVTSTDLAEAEANVRLLALKVEAAKKAVEDEAKAEREAGQAIAQRAYERRRGLHLAAQAEAEAEAARNRPPEVDEKTNDGGRTFGTGTLNNWITQPAGFPFN